MTATLLSEMYEPVRALTGNDDPTLGPEILPAARLDVLLKSAVRTLRTYSESFPAVSVVDTGAGVLGVALTTATTTALSDEMFNAVTLAAAHKYFVSIGYKTGITETLGALAKTAEIVSGIDDQPYIDESTSSSTT